MTKITGKAKLGARCLDSLDPLVKWIVTQGPPNSNPKPPGAKPTNLLQLVVEPTQLKNLLGKNWIISPSLQNKLLTQIFQTTKQPPSRELTYPTLGKGKSSSKLVFQATC